MLELQGKYNKNCKIFCDNVEESALSLIHGIINHPNYADAQIRIMPDVHAGKDTCVGTSLPITKGVNPNVVGCDISCMVSCHILDRKIEPKDYALIEHRVRKEIPFGFEINKARQYEMKEFIKFMTSFYNKQRALWPEMILDFDISEKGFTNWLQKIHMDEGIFYKSISSVGSGNHFIEFGDTETVSAFTIHCGSRNLGIKVCNYWSNIAKSNPSRAKKRLKEKIAEIKQKCDDRTKIPALIEEAKKEIDNDITMYNGYLVGDDLKGYLTDMVIASAYAHFNHMIIARKISDILLKINQAKVVERIVSVHNYIDFEDHMIRKGAIRAYKDEKMVIPFNMRDGLAICVGKSNPDWNFTAPHGCGRIMSRSKAKELLDLGEFKKQMEGIYSTSVVKGTLDEAPDAYKDYRTVVDAIQDTCDILYFIKPIINLKATDNA